ncbi:MAG: hypothetical protein OXE98_06670, partial [Hyphomicrobiales bacterium]|nr:hypothetical protein [Hyphomicrobiales bacterium]
YTLHQRLSKTTDRASRIPRSSRIFPPDSPSIRKENRPFSGKNPTDSLKTRMISPMAYQGRPYPCHITPGKSYKKLDCRLNPGPEWHRWQTDFGCLVNQSTQLRGKKPRISIKRFAGLLFVALWKQKLNRINKILDTV